MSAFGFDAANSIGRVKEDNRGVKVRKLLLVPGDLLLERNDASRNPGSLFL